MKHLPTLEGPLASTTDAQWAELWVKLRIHVWKRYYWFYERTGEDLDEIAHQAIIDTCIGRRCWPPVDKDTGLPKDDVSLFFFLCETVRSQISHTWAKRKNTVSWDGFNSSGDWAQPAEAFRDDTLDIEEAEEYRILTDEMLELVSTDEDVFEIVKLLRACPDLKPCDIAEQLSFTMPQMRAAQKRLRRRLSKFQKVPQ